MPQLSKAQHPRWRGGKTTISKRYPGVLQPEHPRANPRGYVREHIVVAESALGRQLELPHVVHHSTSGLVICEDQAYHMLLHQRQRAYRACGHADWRRCSLCKRYDHPNNLRVSPKKRRSAQHDACRLERQRRVHAEPRRCRCCGRAIKYPVNGLCRSARCLNAGEG